MSHPTPVTINDHYTYRPAQPDDIPGVYQLLAAMAAEQPNNFAQTLAEVACDFADPWAKPETDARVAVIVDGAIVANAHLIANPEPDRPCAPIWTKTSIRPNLSFAIRTAVKWRPSA